MRPSLTVVSLNTESGSRPGFHDSLNQLVTDFSPDVLMLQEVHQAYDIFVPETFMPADPGKRAYPMRLKLFNEMTQLLEFGYNAFYAPHLFGLHDIEESPHNVGYGQAVFVKRDTWTVSMYHTGMIFGKFNEFNQEKVGGKPSAKAALSLRLQNSNLSKQVVLTNVHGFWSRHGKIDLWNRYRQNKGINTHGLALCARGIKPYIMVSGDLNYRRDMKALEHLRRQPLFGADGGVILNRQDDWKIHSTRTAHYANREAEPDADYLIACRDLTEKVVHVKVRMDFPSDHAPLIVRFVF